MKRNKKVNPARLKPGSPCPYCAENKHRFRPKLKFDSEGQCVTVPYKVSKLEKCKCKTFCKGLFCPTCKWSNF